MTRRVSFKPKSTAKNKNEKRKQSQRDFSGDFSISQELFHVPYKSEKKKHKEIDTLFCLFSIAFSSIPR